MGRPSRNKLTILPTKTGFRMFGRVLGEKIRLRSDNRAELEARRVQILSQSSLLAATDANALWQQQINDAIRAIDEQLTSLKELLKFKP